MKGWTEADIEVHWDVDSEPTRFPIGGSFRPDVVFESSAQMYPGFVLKVLHPLSGSTRETVAFRLPNEPPLVVGATFVVMRGARHVGKGRVLALPDATTGSSSAT